ncbi:MAG: glycosyltransferase family 1 protein [Deltaproteobacteria bacterium]|nr:glycosyltransferase family 1 protein [Deltaproteobacteria bacterium]
MARPLRIVTTGLAATYPLGGVFWDYLQYPLGFQRLGHEVLYLEDTGRWCYDAEAQTFVEGGAANARFLAREIARLDPSLAERWFFRDGTGATFGQPWADVRRFVREADLFLHISASCWMRDEYWTSGVVAFIDSDPMYTQASVPGYVAGTIGAEERARVDMLRRHHLHFTFGENVGAPGCKVPTALFDWLPTRQPIVLDCFEGAARPLASRRRVLTTVASWEPHAKPLVVEDVRYFGKSAEFERFLGVPARAALPIEVALSGPAPRDHLRAHGFQLVDPAGVSGDGWVYRDYLADSFAEWSVAKHAYAASKSGWFSCRSACYLALGVPVIVEDTGFGAAIPTGAGVLAFDSPDESVDAIARVEREPERHAAAALAVARSHFDARTVLGALLERALGARRG